MKLLLLVSLYVIVSTSETGADLLKSAIQNLQEIPKNRYRDSSIVLRRGKRQDFQIFNGTSVSIVGPETFSVQILKEPKTISTTVESTTKFEPTILAAAGTSVLGAVEPVTETTTAAAETTTPAAATTIPAAETTIPAAETTIPPAATTNPAAETTIPAAKTTIPPAETTILAAKTTTPAVETTIPAVETTTPAAETTIPPAETTILPAETTIPAVETTIPAAETTIPPAATTVSPVETTIPAAETTTPAAETTIPAAETTLSAAETTIPAVETTTPAAETTIPAAETTIPPAETTTPAAETTIPAAETTLSAAETTIPPAETTIPAAETTTPAAETTIPSAETTIPPAETTTPAAETTIPPAETTTPAAETTTPSAETTIPPAETTTPAAETTIPPAETTIPSAETTIPPAETTTPAAETTIPPAETTIPSAETTIPPAETTTPAAETTIPPAETTIPAAETTIPPAETTIPPAETTIPSAETTIPPAETTTPAAETTIPAAETTTPTTANTTPAAATTTVAAETTTADLTPDLKYLYDALKRIITEPLTKIASLVKYPFKIPRPESQARSAFEKFLDDQIVNLKKKLKHSTKQELDNIKESWIIFKFYLIDLIAPQSKNSKSIGAAAAANYARSTLLRPQLIKKYHKLFADFVKSVQRMPGFGIDKVMDTWDKIQIVLDSYPSDRSDPHIIINEAQKRKSSLIAKFKKILYELQRSPSFTFEQFKENWMVFKLYLDSLKHKSAYIQIKHQFLFSNVAEQRYMRKLFSNFIQDVQRSPDFRIEKLMKYWRFVNKFLKSYEEEVNDVYHVNASDDDYEENRGQILSPSASFDGISASEDQEFQKSLMKEMEKLRRTRNSKSL